MDDPRQLSSVSASSSGNATDDGVDHDRLNLLAYCEANERTPVVYSLSLPIWLLLLAYWAWNTYVRHPQHALDLHRMLLCIPGVSCTFSLLSINYYTFCPWDELGQQLIGAAWVVVTILKEPIILVCLLVVAKGWCITRTTLEPREVAISSWVVALLYTSVVVQLSIGGWLAAIPQLVMWTTLLMIIFSSVLTNLRVLKAQLLALRAFNIDATTTPAYTKYQMFQVLLLSTAAYFACDIALFVLVNTASSHGVWFWHALWRQLLELGTTVAIGYAFRARPFSVLFEQVIAR